MLQEYKLKMGITNLFKVKRQKRSLKGFSMKKIRCKRQKKEDATGSNFSMEKTESRKSAVEQVSQLKLEEEKEKKKLKECQH